MKKAKPPKAVVSAGELQDYVMRMFEIRAQEKKLDKEKDKIKAILIEEIGIGKVLQFDVFRVKIVQVFQRKIPWKDICMSLLKLVYHTSDERRKWLRKLRRDYPKKANSPFAKLTDIKEGAEEDIEAA